MNESIRSVVFLFASVTLSTTASFGCSDGPEPIPEAEIRHATIERPPAQPEEEVELRSEVSLSRFELTESTPEADTSELSRAIRTRLSAFRRCQNTMLVDDDDAEGRFEAMLSVARDGRATVEETSGTDIDNLGLRECVSETLSAIRWHSRQAGDGFKARIVLDLRTVPY